MGNRTVFDTNIWISYFVNSRHKELEAMKVTNGVSFLRSLQSTAELKEVLSRQKFRKYGIDVDFAIMLYKDLTEFYRTKKEFTDCPDPKDNFLFDLAIQGNAKYLVSGDKGVLETPVANKTLKVTTLTAFKEDLISR